MNFKRNKNAGFAAGELIIVILVIGAIIGAGGYVYSRIDNEKQAPPAKTPVKTTPTNTSTVDQNWSEYKNVEYGFTFQYPQAWGTVSVTRKALNESAYETNLPYVVTFRSKEAPQAWIIPSDWKFAPPASSTKQWRRTLTDEVLTASNALQITQNARTTISIVDSGAHGIELLGTKAEVITKISGSQIDFRQGEAYSVGGSLAPKKACLTQAADSTTPAGHPTLACYPEGYRTDFVKFIDSFTSI